MEFKEAFKRYNMHQYNAKDLLELLKKYKERYPQYIKDFVTVDFSNTDLKIQPLMMVIVDGKSDAYTVVKFLVEEMGADVNAWCIHCISVLDRSKHGSDIYNYLVSKGAKTGQALYQEMLAKIKKQ